MVAYPVGFIIYYICRLRFAMCENCNSIINNGHSIEDFQNL